MGQFLIKTGMASYYRYPRHFCTDWAGHTKGKRCALAHTKFWELEATDLGLTDRRLVDNNNMLRGPADYRVVLDSFNGCNEEPAELVYWR